MAKVVIAGTVDVAPERRERAIRDAKGLIDEALGEPGCLAYEWTFDAFDAGRIHVFEEWESEQTLVEHLRAPSYRNMLAHLGRVGIRGAVTRKYRIEIDEPVYDETGKPRGDFFTA
ncbi:MAG: antibiotic biosynthesis monooxygenase [Myxococcota bacterium]|nr:antibiotic biosynthesis monooxygenase [Myxococcota bacterium]